MSGPFTVRIRKNSWKCTSSEENTVSIEGHEAVEAVSTMDHG